MSYTYDYVGRMHTMTTYGTEEATTTWIYSPTTGHLTRKEYDDENGTNYTYTAAGRLETRIWERNVTTEYTYTKGLLTVVDYSDTTPDLTYTHDRLGRVLTVTRGGDPHAEYTYEGPGLTLSQEDMNLDTAVPKSLLRHYDEHLRPQSLAITGDYTTGYDYDPAGRLDRVWHHPTLSDGVPQGAPSFSYGYVDDSYHLLETITGPEHTVNRTWENTRDSLDGISNTTDSGQTVVSSYDYTVNAIGQRESNTAVTPMFNGKSTVWRYNARGELISAVRDTDTWAYRAYQYDAIGNRLFSENENGTITNPPGPNTTSYTPNAVNQYTAIQTGSDPVLVPKHDSDGNLTEDGALNMDDDDRQYIWDAENRLVAVNQVTARNMMTGEITSTSNLVTYGYDHLSRLISRTYVGGTTRYVYDGWNRIAEYSGSTLAKTFAWGLDLSGSLQGAGGVGGLLAVTLHGSPEATYYPTYDGNGNVSEYLDESGDVAAHFEYDPFGNLSNFFEDSAGLAESFSYRFSTKPIDHGTGWYYYGYRWYDPATGRWPSRDPIEEAGGVNLYGFVGNGSISRSDTLGLFFDTLWDIANVVVGVVSLVENIAAGNVKEALVDAAGIIVDGVAVAVPGVPGGAGAAIKIGRAADKAGDAARAADKAKDAAEKARKKLEENRRREADCQRRQMGKDLHDRQDPPNPHEFDKDQCKKLCWAKKRAENVLSIRDKISKCLDPAIDPNPEGHIQQFIDWDDYLKDLIEQINNLENCDCTKYKF